MAIGANQLNAAFDVAVDVFSGRLGRMEGQRKLVSDAGFNASSANDYVGAYIDMRKGKRFARTINLEATGIFLRRLRDEHGPAALATALVACRAHADYYETLGHGRLPAFRRICDEIEAESDLPWMTETQHWSDLEHSIASAAQDSITARQARLGYAKRKPDQTLTLRQEFVRNPDVIAEVLSRTNGTCEHCRQPAPFRRRDGRPYLEVHHRIPLAEDGEDTIENAIGLCPNCHREAHYGEDWEQFRP